MFDGRLPENLPRWPVVTARAILDHCVEVEVSAYRDRQEGSDFLWLDLPALRKGLKQGSVGFDSRDFEVSEV